MAWMSVSQGIVGDVAHTVRQFESKLLWMKTRREPVEPKVTTVMEDVVPSTPTFEARTVTDCLVTWREIGSKDWKKVTYTMPGAPTVHEIEMKILLVIEDAIRIGELPPLKK